LLAIVCVVALAVLVAPRHLARWLVASELRKMGIESAGIESLDVDLRSSEIDLGTFRFWSADAKRGQIGRMALKYNLRNLFDRRALIETFVIEGIDIVAQRGADGAITVNGIELSRFMQPEAVAPSEEAAPDARWGAGIDRFELRSSRFLYRTEVEGELVVEIDRLEIRDARSWEPDTPAILSMTGRINDVDVSMEAETRVFADIVVASAHLRLESLDLPKVSRFVGPLGFERRAGTVDVDMKANVRVDPNGRIELASRGTVKHRDAELSRPEIELTLSQADAEFDTEVVILPDTATTGSGDIRTVLGTGEAHSPGALNLAFDRASVEITEIAFERSPQGLLQVRAKSSIAIEAPRVSAPVALRGERLTLAASELSVAMADNSLKIESNASSELTEMELDVPGKGSVSTASLKLDLTDVRAKSGDNGLSAEGSAAVVAEALQIAQPAGEKSGALDLSIAFGKIDAPQWLLSATPETTEVGGMTSLALSDIQSKVSGAGGASGLGVGEATAELSRVDVRLAGDQATLDLNGRITIRKIGASLPAEDAPPADGPADKLAVSGGGLTVDLSNIGMLSTRGGTSVQGTAAVVAEALKLTRPAKAGEAALDLAIGIGRIEAQQLVVSVAPGSTELSGATKLALSDIRSVRPVSGGASAVRVGGATAELARLNARIAGDGATGGLRGVVTVNEIAASVPAADGVPAINSAVAAATVTLEEAATAAAGKATPWRIAAGGNLRGLSAETLGEAAGKVRIGSVSLSGLRADPAAIILDSITLSGVAAEVSDQTLKGFAGGTPDPPDPRASPDTAPTPATPPAASSAVRIGRLATSDASTIRFRDTSVDPEVLIAVALRELALTTIDTGDSQVRTDIRLAANVNEFTELSLSGWATLLKSPPDFDLVAAVNGLELHAFSPYAAKAVGVNLERGQLTTDVKGTATGGALAGTVNLELEDLGFSPLSAADAKRLSANVGIPIETAVGLLQDAEGRIRLKLPVAGTVNAPEVDLSDAISKAIAGAMTALFPPTAIASLLSSAAGSAMSFQPIVFPPELAELSAEGKTYLDNLARLLAERPKLSISVCGTATAKDLEAYLAKAGQPAIPSAPTATGAPATKPAAPDSQQAPAPPGAGLPAGASVEDTGKVLTRLAFERTRVVRRYLIEKKKLVAKRVRECRPRFDAKDDGPPRVEVSF
jgi:hypothetical protein